MPAKGNFALGKSEKFDVALMRPTVNVKESENQGEQAMAAARTTAPPVKFSKHGTFPGGNPAHPVMDLFGKD
jgi:hypothetical protein